MLGNWLSSRPALWAFLSCALVKSIFPIAFQWRRGAKMGYRIQNRNRKSNVWVENSPFPLEHRRPVQSMFHLQIPFWTYFFTRFSGADTCKADGLATVTLRCIGQEGGWLCLLQPLKAICYCVWLRPQNLLLACCIWYFWDPKGLLYF